MGWVLFDFGARVLILLALVCFGGCGILVCDLGGLVVCSFWV